MSTDISTYMDWPRIEAVVYGEEQSPRDVMGPRITKDSILIQGFFPGAEEAVVRCQKKNYSMEQMDEAGYFAALLPLRKIPAYTFEVRFPKKEKSFADAYAFPCQITADEEKKFLAGVWYNAYEKLGAHERVIGRTKGTYFAVWAPNAIRVSVIGDFDDWDPLALPMHRLPMTGIYELFVPCAKAGMLYKYEIVGKDGSRHVKADPYAFCCEEGGSAESASEITGLSGYEWQDAEWLEAREGLPVSERPISICEADLLKWDDPKKLAAFVKDNGYTHVELHPVMEYLDENTGGYSTSAYYAPTRRLGAPLKLKEVVDLFHSLKIGVILDWTPAQFPAYEGGLKLFDGTPLYEVQDPAYRFHPFYGTLLYNYGSPMVKEFLIANALFWIREYHADGLRFDDVDAMLYLDYGRKPGEYRPNIYDSNENLEAVEFLKHLNSIVKKQCPGTLLIAQEDGLWPELTDTVENDHPGFDFKWNDGWRVDLLDYLSSNPAEKSRKHDQLTLSMLYAYSERYILTLGTRDVGNESAFLEKLWGRTQAERAAALRAAYAYMTVHPGCKMTAPDQESSPEVLRLLRELNDCYRSHPALYELDEEYEGFEWIQLMKYEENVLSFLRRGRREEDTLLVLCNFSADPYENYQTGVPFYGRYKEILNTDDKKFGGTGLINPRAKTSRRKECDERDFSLALRLGAMSVTIFTCTPLPEPVKRIKASTEGQEVVA